MFLVRLMIQYIFGVSSVRWYMPARFLLLVRTGAAVGIEVGVAVGTAVGT